jgi:hypothetical protein
MAFSAIMFHLATNPQIGPAIRKEGLIFLVESGNKNNAEIDQAFNNWSKRKHFSEFLKGIVFIPKTSCRAVQLADFFAYYSRRYMRDSDRFAGKLSLPMGPYLSIIREHVPVWQQIARKGFFKKDLGNIEDAPNFDDPFWGPRGVPIRSS